MMTGPILHYTCLNEVFFTFREYSICSIREQDIMLIKDWRNLQIDILRQQSHISIDEQINYFNTYIWPTFALKQPKQILMSFICKNKLIGYGGLVHISWEDKRCELSFLLNPERHESLQYDADFSAFITLMKVMAFKDLNFHRIFTETFNIRDWHISILEKNGFVREGVLKDHVIINGQYVDSIIHVCLDNENIRK
jgi:RimJ/RimL family protein N-acetyltransferase